MSIRVETPAGEEELTEFVRFHDRVYEGRGAHWPAFVPLELPILMGDSPFCEDRRLRPFVARDGTDVVARGLAVMDERYRRHWNERIGHVVMFEAMPGTRAAVRALMDAASEWLSSEGAVAARAGFGVMDMPFVIDDYDALPPTILRSNPAYYHALLKDAGFESEQGFVDYKIAVRPELVARWESALAAVRRSGYRIVPLRDVPEGDRAKLSTELFNDTFKAHWGITPMTVGEQALLFMLFEPLGHLDTCVVAYEGDHPVGQVTVVPEGTGMAALAPRRTLADAEKLNWLGIGVREVARGRGVNLAMAAYAYLELVRRGATHVSYTLVLDDNWPSRRTAEKLGAEVCASYLAYRRDLR